MAKHMAGKNQRPYSAEDRARRAAKADPRSTASELTPGNAVRKAIVTKRKARPLLHRKSAFYPEVAEKRSRGL